MKISEKWGITLALVATFSVSVTPAVLATDAMQNQTVIPVEQQAVNQTSTSSVEQQQKENQKFSVPAKAAIAVDSKTGEILYAQNANQVLPIASMTKMISCAVVLDKINEGTLNWTDKVTIGEGLATLSVAPDLSNVPLTQGQSYSVQDLFNATIVQSANAAIMALAAKVAGSQDKFVELMRQKVKQWGIKNAHLISASGLNNAQVPENLRVKGTAENDENKMSAKDVAIVSQHIVNEYPDYLKVSRQSVMTFAKGTESATDMTNWDQMLPNQPVYTPGVDGLKTGTTEAAGACFAGTIKRNNWRIVTVVMNVDNGIDDKTARFVATKDLMEYVYKTYEHKTLIKKGDKIKGIEDISVPEGKETTVPVVSRNDVVAVVKKGQKPSYKVTNIKKEEMMTPVRKGEKAATFEIEIQNSLGYVDAAHKTQYIAQANADDDKANVFVLGGRKIKNWFANLF